MANKDKDIKQKVAEYMEIMGIYVPPEDNEAVKASDQVAKVQDKDGQSAGGVV